MEVKPTDKGILVIPETEFETNYLQSIFTNNDNRKVTFNHDTGFLKIEVIEKTGNDFARA